MTQIWFGNFNHYKKIGCIVVAEFSIDNDETKIRREIVKNIDRQNEKVLTIYGNVKPKVMWACGNLKEAMEFVNANKC